MNNFLKKIELIDTLCLKYNINNKVLSGFPINKINKIIELEETPNSLRTICLHFLEEWNSLKPSRKEDLLSLWFNQDIPF